MSDEAKRPLSTAVKAAGLALFIVLGIYGVSTSGEDAANGDDLLDRSEAWSACKEAVTEQLNNPATADFSILSSTIKADGGGYDIAGTLTGENDFGVKAEIAYSCEVTADGQVTAEVAEAN